MKVPNKFNSCTFRVTKNQSNPYFPQIPPERDIHTEMWRKIEEQRGTDAITRGPTEEFIMTCRCGELWVTSEVMAPLKFEKDHAACRTDDSSR